VLYSNAQASQAGTNTWIRIGLHSGTVWVYTLSVMARIETTTRVLYKFSELSEEAKQRAIEKEAESAGSDFWTEPTIEDFERICNILGVTLKQRQYKTIGGDTRYEPAVYWSGFSSQGDGASFEGEYEYKAGSAKAIREYAPKDEKLHAIADDLLRLQKPFLFGLQATITQSGNNVHEYTMTISPRTKFDDVSEKWSSKAIPEDELTDCFRRLAKWVYRSLEAEYDYQTSEEAAREKLEDHDGEDEFTEEGKKV
jgi:hypothetical protein